MMHQTIRGKPVVIVSSRVRVNGLRRITPIFKKYGWLKRYTGIPTLTKTEANEEALCFDLIDNLVQSIDDKRYM